MTNLPPHLTDAALNMADNIECLFGDGRAFNAQMIATAIAEGVRSAKANESPKTNGDWHDSACQLAYVVNQMITCS
jgi:hypothetical protein